MDSFYRPAASYSLQVGTILQRDLIRHPASAPLAERRHIVPSFLPCLAGQLPSEILTLHGGDCVFFFARSNRFFQGVEMGPEFEQAHGFEDVHHLRRRACKAGDATAILRLAEH